MVLICVRTCGCRLRVLEPHMTGGAAVVVVLLVVVLSFLVRDMPTYIESITSLILHSDIIIINKID